MNGPGSLRLPLYVFIQNAQVCAASIMSLEGKVHFMADIGKAIKDGIDGAGKELGKAANNIGAKAGDAAGFIGGQLGELRDRSGEALKEAGDGLANIIDNITNHREGDGEHDSDHQKLDEYEVAIVEYNQAYTDMSDYGVRLHQERERSGDLLSLVEVLINSIANSPKEFQATFEEIRKDKAAFTEAEQYAKEELNAARQSAMSAGGGIAAGAAVASMAPTAAMWIATTFGTASTGTAISTLSGAAASQAALAWLGGGALAAGGGRRHGRRKRSARSRGTHRLGHCRSDLTHLDNPFCQEELEAKSQEARRTARHQAEHGGSERSRKTDRIPLAEDRRDQVAAQRRVQGVHVAV